MILYDAIMYKYPNAVSRKDFELRNDGNGSYIEKWNLRAPLPTQAELETWWEELQKIRRTSRLIRWSFSLKIVTGKAGTQAA